MKKVIIGILFLSFSLAIYSQSCERREGKLLEAFGSFSAATMYNTYSSIGSIGDGFGCEVYKSETVNDLLTAQKNLIDNLVKVIEDLINGNFLINQSDMDYANSTIYALNGLKKQSQLMLAYVKSKSQEDLKAYDDQRKKNWKDISKLMGIEE